MPARFNAYDFLHFGDSIRQRVAIDRTTVAAVAADAGLDSSCATKAAWLAGVVDGSERALLGRAVLTVLTPAHVEAAAKASPGVRVEALRNAAKEGVSARALRAKMRNPAGRSSTAPAVVRTTPDDLERLARAMHSYAQFDDRSLKRLVSGPNGSRIQTAARAGRELAARIEEFTPSH